ncbi:MAG TPA: hypothetical protein VK638_45130 [Edaphobacter sp.]|nr:hypothetical protein [Edaphobacter sp.]
MRQPAAARRPVPSKAIEEGSGTAGVEGGVLIPDIPVAPAAFMMSAAK